MAVDDTHLHLNEVLVRFGVSSMTLRRWMADPNLDFPKAIKVKNRRYFRLSDIEAWVRKRSGPESTENQIAGRQIISGVIQNYPEFSAAMRKRRIDLRLSTSEVETLSGLQEGYIPKLENYARSYGRGMGAETMPLWLGGLRIGLVLVELPRRVRKPRGFKDAVSQSEASVAA